MINHLEVSNLRAFKESASLKLNDLTILVGENSSGKSTLTRLLPLLRQSVEAKTQGPILWFGDYVDFGTFGTALCKKSASNQISISLVENFIYGPALHGSSAYREGVKSDEHDKLVEAANMTYTLFLLLKEESGKTVTESLLINHEDYSFGFAKDTERGNWLMFINNKVIDPTRFLLNDSVTDGLIPTVTMTHSKDTTQKRESWRDRYMLVPFETVLNLSVFKEFLRYFHGRSDKRKILSSLLSVAPMNNKLLFSFLKEKFKWHEVFIGNLNEKTEEVLRAATTLLVLVNYNFIVWEFNDSIKKSLSDVRYIGPFRATAERFYRFQDLQVDELDYKGSNLVMLLSSLGETKLEELSQWIKENFGFELMVEPSGSHYALQIRPEGYDNYNNISDMGFGFSQILPILVSVWEAENHQHQPSLSRGILRKKIFVIEQPELHLHPKMQTLLAKTIARIAGSNDSRVRFLIETHSKYFIDAVGAAIRAKHINEDQVTVSIVERSDEPDTSITKDAKFNSNGTLSGWPIGFFSGEGVQYSVSAKFS